MSKALGNDRAVRTAGGDVPPPDPALLRGVLDATGEGVVICDERLRYVWANPAACRLMGVALEDIVGRCFLMSFPERAHAAMVEAYQAQMEGRTGTFTGTLLRPDGTEVDITWSNSVFQHGGARYGAAVFRDVTRLTAVTRAASELARVAETAPGGGELLDVLRCLAESGRTNTRALTVSLDLVDDDQVIRRGGRAGAPAGFAEAQTEVSAAGGRIPFLDVWYAGRAVVLADARTRLREDARFLPLCDVLDAALDWQTAVYIAIGYRGNVLGGLAAYFPAGIPTPTDQELAYLTTLADHAALATEHARLRKASERAASLEERARLARELHDSVSQALFSMTLHARAADKNLARLEAGEPADALLPKVHADVGALRELTATALAEMRALIFELRPDAVAEQGLVAALSHQAAALGRRSGVPVTVTGPQERLRVDARTEEHAYRIALEAVNNALKHAAASHVRVAVTDLGDAVDLVVTDDGQGFDPTAAYDGHLGLRTMRERACSIGAALDLHTAPGLGTTVRLTLTEATPPQKEGSSA
ncbi:hypothetical protein AQJ66_24585 [Streptomyces bungoensis]|uniref:PAS domain-containing protein n=1 Tax=Streptomyces bungoensis TaxID=285568 RepID=A0A101SVZ0_9ACTN|nr:histidine kinase [Streptomyces bungoensis]KUN81142.1 hypothetical protein AQJ66_24585 [Streptomyces bungoensis]